MDEPKKVKGLIEKYATQTPEEMEKIQDELEQEYAAQCVEMDQNIRKFSSKTDPLIVDGKTLAVIKRPSASQYRRIIPPELAKFRKNPQDIPYELAMKYQDDIYRLMEEMIIKPKHDAKWWENNTGPEFMGAFQAHVVNIGIKLQESIDGFLGQTSDSRS